MRRESLTIRRWSRMGIAILGLLMGTAVSHLQAGTCTPVSATITLPVDDVKYLYLNGVTVVASVDTPGGTPVTHWFNIADFNPLAYQ